MSISKTYNLDFEEPEQKISSIEEESDTLDDNYVTGISQVDQHIDLKTLTIDPLVFVPLESVVPRSLQFKTVDDLLQFARTASTSMDYNAFIESLDHAIEYFVRFIMKDTEQVNNDMFTYVTSLDARLTYIRGNMRIIKDHLLDSEYNLVHSTIMQLIDKDTL